MKGNDAMSYPKSVLKKAMNELKEKQKEVKAKNVAEKEKIYSELPELKELNGRIKNVMMSIFDGIDTDTIKRELRQIECRKKELLRNAGYSERALSDKYYCPMCRDEGFFEGSRCVCYLYFIKKEAYKLSNLGARIEKENFETYNSDLFADKELAESFKRGAERFCDFDRDIKNLIFSGKTGTGKTFLSSCIAKRFLDNGYSVLYLSATSLSDALDKAKFRKEDDNFNEEYLDFIESCDLLIIDDLGTEYLYSYPQSKIFDILERRIIEEKRTVISTNLSLDEIAVKYSPRFHSRIMQDYTQMIFNGDDLRARALKS